MTQRITAIVEQGRLRPTAPLNLAEGTEVEIVILPTAPPLAEPQPPRRDVKDIIAEIAALPMEGDGEPFTSRDHDRILYGENGAMILVDTGAWFAGLIPTDPDYAAAVAWLDCNREPLLTTDYIIDETLTLLRARGQRSPALEAGARFFAGELATVHHLSPQDVARAWDVFRRYADKDWSFTDCTSKVVMETLHITTAFTFDHHFRQFGNVIVVP